MYDILPMIMASGSGLWSEDGRTATFDSPAVREVLELHKRLWESGQVDPAAQTDNGSNFLGAFMSDKVGIEGLGAFAIGAIRTDTPDVEFGVAAIPGSGGESAVFSGGDVLAISSGAKNPDGAREFIDWVLSDEVQLEQLAAMGMLTSRLDLASNEYTEDDPQLIAQAQAQAVGFVPLHPHYAELQDLFATMFSRAVFDGDVEGAVAAAQEQATRIIAE
jgi:multiple sugar transport system substrate-binding protein